MQKAIPFSVSDKTTWPPVLTIGQTAQILSVSVWTLRSWDKKGKLNPIRIGNRRDRRYKKEDIEIIIQQGI